jgi:pSer/pThr/pTyr-binding forkhead associated (FHA) protein
MQAKIILSLNNKPLGEHLLDAEIVSIGRKPGSDIHIDNLAVSGRHARILVIGGEAFIEDLQSTNGTFINGQKISKQMLKHGDRISIGQHVLTYENESADSGDLEKTVVIRPYAVGMEGPVPSPSRIQPPATPAQKPAAREERPAYLELTSGPNQGKKLALNQAITRLGKPGEQVAAIAKRPQGYFIMHLGGDIPPPLLNGAKVGTQATLLKHGDLIVLGKVQMTIRIPDSH